MNHQKVSTADNLTILLIPQEVFNQPSAEIILLTV